MSEQRLRQIWQSIPTLRDYQNRERRREIDRRLRDALAEALEQVRRQLTDIQQELSDQSRGLEWLDDLARVHDRLMLLIDEIRTTTDSYRAFFDLEQVDVEDLEQLRAFDQTFAEQALNLRDQVRALRQAWDQSDEAFQEALSTAMRTLSRLLDTYQRRKDLLRHAQTRLPG